MIYKLLLQWNDNQYTNYFFIKFNQCRYQYFKWRWCPWRSSIKFQLFMDQQSKVVDGKEKILYGVLFFFSFDFFFFFFASFNHLSQNNLSKWIILEKRIKLYYLSCQLLNELFAFLLGFDKEIICHSGMRWMNKCVEIRANTGYSWGICKIRK